ncbi:MAG: hypothetical protein AAF902_16845, partial [Chloroflexota bacterium]
MTSSKPFKWRHFQSDLILLNVRWYLRYSLSYRDLEEMMLERGVKVDHTTIYRWVQAYSPELDKRCRPYLRPTNDSWRGSKMPDLGYHSQHKIDRHPDDPVYCFWQVLRSLEALKAQQLQPMW